MRKKIFCILLPIFLIVSLFLIMSQVNASYTEQPPPLQSEWDGAYDDNVLAIEKAKWWVNRPADTTDYRIRYGFDRNPLTCYRTSSNIGGGTNLDVHMYWANETEFDYLRFYYYDTNGLDYCPAEYCLYADGVYQECGDYTASVNGQWVKWDFTNVSATNITWIINETSGSGSTKVSIAEIEVFSTEAPWVLNQEDISYFEGIPMWWNGMDWAMDLHVDDVTTISTLPTAWRLILPLTPVMQGSISSGEVPASEVDTYHIEYGSHSISHPCDSDNMTYAQGLSRGQLWSSEVEDAATKTSLWGTTCISFAVPCTRANWQYNTGMYDGGFRILGQIGGHTVHGSSAGSRTWQLINPQNMSLSNYTYPISEQSWMGICREGSKPQVGSGWTTDELIEVRENGSLADMMLHDHESMISTFKPFVENDTTGWHATWGELVSYWWWKEYTNVTYNSTASSNTKKVFNTHIHNSDDRMWDVPVTFKFNIPNWSGTAVVKWPSNNTVYSDTWDNISGFSIGSGQHTNQTMREG